MHTSAERQRIRIDDRPSAELEPMVAFCQEGNYRVRTHRGLQSRREQATRRKSVSRMFLLPYRPAAQRDHLTQAQQTTFRYGRTAAARSECASCLLPRVRAANWVGHLRSCPDLQASEPEPEWAAAVDIFELRLALSRAAVLIATSSAWSLARDDAVADASIG